MNLRCDGSMRISVRMWTMKTCLAIGITALVLTGCKKKDAGSEGSVKAAEGPSAFSAWTQKDAAKLWDGAWTSRMNLQSNKKKTMSMAGEPVALEIKDGKATVNGGDKDQPLGFSFEAPCAAKFAEEITEGSMKGGTSYITMLFVVQNGELVVGSGAGGYRKGKAAIVCSEGMDGGIHIVEDNGTCVTWSQKFKEWEKKPNTCVWSQKDGKDVLTIGTGDWSTVVVADGDVLESEQFTEWSSKSYHKRAKDFADAKAQTLAKIKESDPAEQAKAAGGVVGKTDTVLSLIATAASDPALKGKPVELTALYLNSGSSTDKSGKTTESMVLVESKEQLKLSITCELGDNKAPEGLVQYDKVTVKGTLDESFGKPALQGCTATKVP